MFVERITHTAGAPIAIQQSFLLEHQLDVPSFNAHLFVARDKNTGQKVWLKCATEEEGSAAGIRSEAKLLSPLDHPHILHLGGDFSLEDPPYITFPWMGETRLSQIQMDEMPLPDRIHLIADIHELVEHLSARKKPIAHGKIDMEHVWITPAAKWIKLTGFQQATRGATSEQLSADRQAAWNVMSTLAFGGDGAPDADTKLRLLAKAWLVDGSPASQDFKEMLTKTLVQSVTTDF